MILCYWKKGAMEYLNIIAIKGNSYTFLHNNQQYTSTIQLYDISFHIGDTLLIRKPLLKLLNNNFLAFGKLTNNCCQEDILIHYHNHEKNYIERYYG